MVEVTVAEVIRCTPEEFLAFVLDPEAYARVDDKIGAIDWVRREGDLTEFRFRPKLPGVPGPAPKLVSQMRLTPGERVDVRYAPLPQNRLNHRLSRFAASFAAAPADGGTRVTRTISIDFAPFARWLLEPILRRTLPADVAKEIHAAKAHLEAR
ncbi:carbon monoxide dehydrogenase subunit G [Murinocardiopsis flavida]|uniref:Carbon monoxide dehydrogenase subunit G n=1 Tax=Murinocardiopsis flavida TaxID=645275 RepID=A0A2P8CXA8_9ACTN|nr:SRPBCC family protein [Murinocardiopsis flavida]PSK89608.1 carbon monoxide dehydrogenase subunit G [Murinocardiopsis flavida]